MDFFILAGVIILYVVIALALYKSWVYLVKYISKYLFSGYYYNAILVLGIPYLCLVFLLAFYGLKLIL